MSASVGGGSISPTADKLNRTRSADRGPRRRISARRWLLVKTSSTRISSSSSTPPSADAMAPAEGEAVSGSATSDNGDGPLRPPFTDARLIANPMLLEILTRLPGADRELFSFGAVVSQPGAEDQHVHRDGGGLFGDPVIERERPSLRDHRHRPARRHEHRNGHDARLARQSSDDQGGTSDRRPQDRWSRRAASCSWTIDCITAVSPILSGPRPILSLVFTRPWWRDDVNFGEQPPCSTPRSNESDATRARSLLPAHGGVSIGQQAAMTGRRILADPKALPRHRPSRDARRHLSQPGLRGSLEARMTWRKEISELVPHPKNSPTSWPAARYRPSHRARASPPISRRIPSRCAIRNTASAPTGHDARAGGESPAARIGHPHRIELAGRWQLCRRRARQADRCSPAPGRSPCHPDSRPRRGARTARDPGDLPLAAASPPTPPDPPGQGCKQQPEPFSGVHPLSPPRGAHLPRLCDRDLNEIAMHV